MATSTFQPAISALLPIPAPVFRLAARALAFHRVEETYAVLHAAEATTFLDRLLQRLLVTCRVAERDVAQIPLFGPAIVVANHPFGLLEGAVLATVPRRVRPAVRFLANGILVVFPEVRDVLLVVFPAGAVSHFDPEWNPAVARLVSICSRLGVSVPVVPAYVEGRHSLLFQAAGLVHPRLLTALLARELFNKQRRSVELRLGTAVESGKLPANEGDGARTAYLRWRTYLLAERQAFKPRTAKPHQREPGRKQAAELMPAVDPALLDSEIALLPATARLVESAVMAALVATATQIPCVLQELGLLREKTFRAVGEGTGRSLDLDPFDRHYLHLFVWHAERREVVSAYRLATTGQTGWLYTASLFRYSRAFLDKLGLALELGRSFVREEYQKGFAPLLLPWKGIGRFVARNPRYKMLFGPVRISNSYQVLSRELMVSFLERHTSLSGWMGLVRERHPFRRTAPAAGFPVHGFDIDDLSEVVSDIEPGGAGIPVLLRQYLKLGGKPRGFNVDPGFPNALDGLILVDLTQTEPKLLHRYLGGIEATAFLEYQKRQHGTL